MRVHTALRRHACTVWRMLKSTVQPAEGARLGEMNEICVTESKLGCTCCLQNTLCSADVCILCNKIVLNVRLAH